MKVIGLTGGSGSGKSTAMAVLAEMGAHTIDCDAVYHGLLEAGDPMLDEIERRFLGMVVVDGRLDRKALGKIVFNDPAALRDLSAITHSHVCRAADERLADLALYSPPPEGCPPGRAAFLVAIEAIALIESGLNQRCDFVVAVLAPIEDRVRRITARDGIAPDYAKARIESQKPDEFFRAQCDYILENTCPSQEAFAERCREFFGRILRD